MTSRLLLVSLAIVACSPPTAKVPGAPTNPTGVAGHGEATLTWTAPTDDGGAAITSYTVTMEPGHIVKRVFGATTLTLTDLTDWLDYTFTVRATNSVGEGPASEWSPTFQLMGTPVVPSAPATITVTPGIESAAVEWSPASSGTSSVLSYTVTAYGTVIGNPIVVHERYLKFTGLTPGDTYRFHVSATNAVGTGPDGVSDPVTIPNPMPPSPPTNVSAVSQGDRSAVVSWTAPTDVGGSAILHYQVTASDGAAIGAIAEADHALFQNLTPGMMYRFRVHASNLQGDSAESAFSNFVLAKTFPSEPTQVVVTPGVHSATVTWQPPVSDGWSPITDYWVAGIPPLDSGESIETMQLGPEARSTTFTGLSSGHAYWFQVTAGNEIGAFNTVETSTVTIP